LVDRANNQRRRSWSSLRAGVQSVSISKIWLFNGKLTVAGPERNPKLEARVTFHRTYRRRGSGGRIFPRASTTSKHQRDRSIGGYTDCRSVSTTTTIWPRRTRHGSILGGTTLVISPEAPGHPTRTITGRAIHTIIYAAQMAVLGPGITAPATRR
jgi:hypothetical protein